MRVLAIESAGAVGSVALLEDRRLVAAAAMRSGKGGLSRWLLPAVKHILAIAGWEPGELDRIAVNRGPGSFTGIRIGIATAEGLAFGWDKPVVGVHGLEALGWQAVAASGGGALPFGPWRTGEGDGPAGPPVVLSMVDARHGNVFAAAYRVVQHDEGPCTLQSMVAAAQWPVERFFQEVRAVLSEGDGGNDDTDKPAPVPPIVLAGDGGVAYEAMAKEVFGEAVWPVPLGGERLRAETVALWAAAAPDESLGEPLPLYLKKPDAKLRRPEAQRPWVKTP